jgi:hypothetical protein
VREADGTDDSTLKDLLATKSISDIRDDIKARHTEGGKEILTTRKYTDKLIKGFSLVFGRIGKTNLQVDWQESKSLFVGSICLQ